MREGIVPLLRLRLMDIIPTCSRLIVTTIMRRFRILDTHLLRIICSIMARLLLVERTRHMLNRIGVRLRRCRLKDIRRMGMTIVVRLRLHNLDTMDLHRLLVRLDLSSRCTMGRRRRMDITTNMDSMCTRRLPTLPRRDRLRELVHLLQDSKARSNRVHRRKMVTSRTQPLYRPVWQDLLDHRLCHLTRLLTNSKTMGMPARRTAGQARRLLEVATRNNTSLHLHLRPTWVIIWDQHQQRTDTRLPLEQPALHLAIRTNGEASTLSRSRGNRRRLKVRRRIRRTVDHRCRIHSGLVHRLVLGARVLDKDRRGRQCRVRMEDIEDRQDLEDRALTAGMQLIIAVMRHMERRIVVRQEEGTSDPGLRRRMDDEARLPRVYRIREDRTHTTVRARWASAAWA